MDRREFLAASAAALMFAPPRAAVGEGNPIRIMRELAVRAGMGVDERSFEAAAQLLDEPVIPAHPDCRHRWVNT